MDLNVLNTRCDSLGLKTYTEIADALMISPQTLRNWRIAGSAPDWVDFSLLALENGLPPITVNVTNFKAWQKLVGLKTYEDTGQAFGRKRQSVHQWFRRGSFPNWLALACPGYAFKIQINAGDASQISSVFTGKTV